jgi:molybdopterin/thiamine biosynthesis adenylyltransferase
MEQAARFLTDRCNRGILPWPLEEQAMARFNLSPREVDEIALSLGLLPERYLRNMGTISIHEQHTLLKSAVAVVGCGGLGGYVIEELARLGVGTIKAIDPDVFQEHNLNRQILCTRLTIGRPKVEAARERVALINPSVSLIPFREAFGKATGGRLLENIAVAVDGLDSIRVRIELSEACEVAGIPLVHGTIGGWYGQVATQVPGAPTVQTIYRSSQGEKGVEQVLGTPAFSPAAIASFQAAEVCKILLSRRSLLSGRLLFLNLLDMEVEKVDI